MLVKRTDKWGSNRKCLEEFLDEGLRRGIFTHKGSTRIPDIFDFAEKNPHICTCTRQTKQS